MLPIALGLRPGVDTQKTPLQNMGGVSQSNLIRHKEGLIQKLGGCSRLSNDLFVGQARCPFPWADLVGERFLAVATNERLELFWDGLLYDITPIVQTDDLTTPFTTVAGSSIVEVADAGYSPVAGSSFTIVNATYVGGLVLQGTYQVLADGIGTFTFDAGILATSSVSGGGAVVHFTTTNMSADVVITLGTYDFFQSQSLVIGVSTAVGGVTLFGPYNVDVNAGPIYSINAGSAATSGDAAYENGDQTRISYLLHLPAEELVPGTYGSGAYGAGPYGVGGAIAEDVALVGWSLDKWGEDLVAAFQGSTVYEWVPPVAPGNVAAPVSGAPIQVNGIFTAAPEQQLVVWGAYSATLGEQDPLLLAWCDVADLNDWTASATNQAGSFRLSTGSEIIAGLWFGLIGLVWTDLDFWTMTYIGFPFVYGVNKVAPNCGLISRRAAAVLGTVVGWMSQNDFFVFSGGAVSPLTCTVRDFVFDNLDRAFIDAVFAAPNTYFNEIAWWFPTNGSNGVCNAYAKWNVSENLWDYGYGALQRAAWTDQSVLGAPIGADYAGLLQQAETALDFDGVVLDTWFLSGWFQLAEGEEFIFLERILPDFVLNSGGKVAVTVYVADNMAATLRTYGPYTVSSTTQYFPVRARGRVARVRVDCTSPNTFWRYGKPLAVVAADGRR